MYRVSEYHRRFYVADRKQSVHRVSLAGIFGGRELPHRVRPGLQTGEQIAVRGKTNQESHHLSPKSGTVLRVDEPYIRILRSELLK